MRAVARADIKVEYSHGFNPKPKISFSNPTPLGIESLAEYSDILLADGPNPNDFKQRLNVELKDKLKAVEAKTVKEKVKSLMADIAVVLYSFKLGNAEGMDTSQQIKRQLDGQKDFKNTIYRIEFLSGGKNFSLLKLYGYAKILKNKDNSIFKYNYFYDYFKDMAGKYSINIYSVVKEEMFVLRENILKTPMEVI